MIIQPVCEDVSIIVILEYECTSHLVMRAADSHPLLKKKKKYNLGEIYQ